VADKDVKVSEAAWDEDAALVEGAATMRDATPAAARADAAQAGQSEIVQSEIAQPEDEQAEIVQSEIAQPEDEQAEVAQPEDGQAEDGQAEDGKSEIVQSEDGQSEVGQPEKDLPEAGAEPGETTPSGRPGWRIAAALGAVTVVLAGFGVWATLHASSLRSNAAAQENTALTDGPATATVRREISAAVNTIFSYNYADTAATRRAAQGVLTGPAVRQYNTLFALVTKNAPAQKLVVTTKVTNSGVELLNGNSARLLVFADQQDARAGTGQTSYAGAMFAVTAQRQGGRWKIENIDTFSG
jgi:Mce-associated membrane protein